MSAQTIAEAKCQEIYREAQTFFNQISYLPNYYGFKVLMGPPLFQPPVLFVGYQPGGGKDDGEWEAARGSDKHWPPTCEYATESWPLAKKMRGMFGRQYLEKCVGMNAIFLRYPKADKYKSDFDSTMRAQIEGFCLPRVGQIIEAIDPLKIVAIGLDTLKLFAASAAPDLQNENERVLTTVGQIAGRPAIATLHLSAAYISNPDRERIRDHVLAQ